MAEWTRQTNANADRVGGGDGVRFFKVSGLAQNTQSEPLNVAGAHKVWLHAPVAAAIYAFDPIGNTTKTLGTGHESLYAAASSVNEPGYWVNPPAFITVAHSNASAQDIIVEVHYPRTRGR